MSDTVLDLSAKSTSDGALAARSLSRETPPSPSTPSRRRHSSDDGGNDSDTSLHRGSSSRYISRSQPSLPLESGSGTPSPAVDYNDKRSPASSPVPSSSSLTHSPRPFKSYPADSMASIFSPSSPGILPGQNGLPTSMPLGLGLTSLYDTSAGFPTFPITPLTSHLLQRKRRAESRTSVSQDSNSDSDSKNVKHVPEEKKDSSYWERRRKNNEAAKRSRDNRRQKEEEIAMRAAFLEQENLKLRAQVAILKNETAKLHYMLYNRI